MNGEASHIKDMTDMVAHYVGMNVSGASMLGMDRLGIDIQVSRNEQSFKLRLPFIRWVEFGVCKMSFCWFTSYFA